MILNSSREQHLEQSVRELQTDMFYGESITTDNIKIKRNKKRRALRGNQRVVLLTNSAGKQTVALLIPLFKNFFNPFFVMRNANRFD